MNSTLYWQELGKLCVKPFNALGLLAIFFYKVILSPYMGGHCRFHPTCSDYAVGAIQKFGIFRSLPMIFNRICRCRPFGAYGEDPIPQKK